MSKRCGKKRMSKEQIDTNRSNKKTCKQEQGLHRRNLSKGKNNSPMNIRYVKRKRIKRSKGKQWCKEKNRSKEQTCLKETTVLTSRVQ